jgi:hypothetical protein
VMHRVEWGLAWVSIGGFAYLLYAIFERLV